MPLKGPKRVDVTSSVDVIGSMLPGRALDLKNPHETDAVFYQECGSNNVFSSSQRHFCS